jgi:MATE family multidrug resistance protein
VTQHTRDIPARPPALTSRDVLAISVPVILSNISTPLLGLTSTAVIGQLGKAHLIGAVAIGAAVFSLMFWAFGFLRMGTTGLCAQADGRGDEAEVSAILARALLMAAGAGTVLVLLQIPLEWLSFRFMQASPEVEEEARGYFAIRIWSAPFALANYALLGWFIGLGKARLALVMQIVLNGSNIVLNVLLVTVLGYGVDGVAAGTVAAEAGAVLPGLYSAMRILRERHTHISWPAVFASAGLLRMAAVNADLMVRTLCLLFAFAFFTAQAARAGDVILAANAVLKLLLDTSAYLLDGFAFAAEVLTGRAIGGGSRARFRRAIWLCSGWTAVMCLSVSAVFLLTGGRVIDALTPDLDVRAAAKLYLPWAATAPLAGAACFQLDGIFIGATRTQDMRNMMLVSLALFFAAWAALTPAFGNHGLWASLMVFFAVRAVTLAMRFPALERAAFPSS